MRNCAMIMVSAKMNCTGLLLPKACAIKSRIAGEKPVFILADAQALAIRDFAFMANTSKWKLESINDPRWGALHLLAYYSANIDKTNQFEGSVNEAADILGVPRYKIRDWQDSLAMVGHIAITRRRRKIQLFMISTDGKTAQPCDPYKPPRPNPERKPSINRKQRIRIHPNTMTDDDWEYALEYFDYRCAVCGQPEGNGRILAADHWIPITFPDSPGTVRTNIIPLCHGKRGCNNSKHDQHPLKWLLSKYPIEETRAIRQRIERYFRSLK